MDQVYLAWVLPDFYYEEEEHESLSIIPEDEEFNS